MANTKNNGAWNKAKTHCPQGHPYDEANTCHLKTGQRQCRACTNFRSKKIHARKKALRDLRAVWAARRKKEYDS
jgi:hypothetical protein